VANVLVVAAAVLAVVLVTYFHVAARVVIKFVGIMS
jgi:hypothetical protein